MVLIVLDGWGIGRKDHSNPLYVLKPGYISEVKKRYFSGALQSSGIAVGLPWEEEGNSEVGHLTLGAGKIIYQHYPRITLAIQRGDFFKNKVLLDLLAHVKATGGALHLAGLLTEGNVHASLEHLSALIKIAKAAGVSELYLDLFSDGKDSGPRSLRELLEKVEKLAKEAGIGSISTISGRYYALDRDDHWDRTRRTYEAMTGKGTMVENARERIAWYYGRGLTDEFIEPMRVGSTPHSIKDGDALFFFDFREDSIRQLAASFTLKEFGKFTTQPFKNLAVATMTRYSEKLDAPVAFPSETVEAPLGKVLSDRGITQLRIAETEKYAHVTFFFNGYREKPFANEYRVLVPSRSVARHDEAPEMMAKEISTRVVEAVSDGGFGFILANFANPDMIAHTGNYDAALQAISAVDKEISRVAEACLERDVPLAITSDHGNIERMLDPYTGRPETKHDPNPVPFYLIGRQFERRKTDWEAEMIEENPIGILSDVAPTILEIMGFPKPPEMTGESLLKLLR